MQADEAEIFLCGQVVDVRITFPRSMKRNRLGRGFLGKPTLKQILDALKGQILVGKSYLGIAKGLLSTDPVILDGARTFFGLTINGSLELAQMAIAKLYDRTKGAVTIPAMLVRATTDIDL